MMPRFAHSDQMELKVQSIDYLQAIKEKSIERITIQLTTDIINEQTVEELNEIISSHPGKTRLFFLLSDSQGKHRVLMQSKSKTIDVRVSLIDYINETKGLEYKIN